ncbi:MAG: hypothetical protein ACE3JP_08600 [Ectobacillus sp.]
MRNIAKVTNSGNANVNVNVQVDTSALAYAMACYWHTSRMITDEQFVHMVSNLNSLLGKTESPLPPLLSNTTSSPSFIHTKNDISTLKKFF